MRKQIETTGLASQLQLNLGQEFNLEVPIKSYIKYKRFVFLLNKSINEAEGIAASLDGLISQINECIDAGFNIVYLADQNNNLGFKYLEKSTLGFNTNCNNSVSKLKPDDNNSHEDDMVCISRGTFLRIWINLKENYSVELSYLNDLIDKAEILKSNNFLITCFIDEQGELGFSPVEKEGIGFTEMRHLST